MAVTFLSFVRVYDFLLEVEFQTLCLIRDKKKRGLNLIRVERSLMNNNFLTSMHKSTIGQVKMHLCRVLKSFFKIVNFVENLFLNEHNQEKFPSQFSHLFEKVLTLLLTSLLFLKTSSSDTIRRRFQKPRYEMSLV